MKATILRMEIFRMVKFSLDLLPTPLTTNNSYAILVGRIFKNKLVQHPVLYPKPPFGVRESGHAFIYLWMWIYNLFFGI